MENYVDYLLPNPKGKWSTVAVAMGSNENKDPNRILQHCIAISLRGKDGMGL